MNAEEIMDDTCTLSCGFFEGIDPESYTEREPRLQKTFSHMQLDGKSGTLDICGAKDMAHDPGQLSEIFDTLSKILGPRGKGRILLTCETTEICYFRRNMWKLLPVPVPDDPFENIRYVEG